MELIDIIKQYPFGEDGLKFYEENHNKIRTIQGIGSGWLVFKYNDHGREMETLGLGFLPFPKLILKPLSDLTVTQLNELHLSSTKEIPDLSSLHTNGGCGVEDLIYVINKLFEWKFDVFELIPKGQAIDVNSINKKIY